VLAVGVSTTTSTTTTAPDAPPVGLSESELARRIGKSVGYVAALRREGKIVPLCRLTRGQLVYHPSTLTALQPSAALEPVTKN
jgi:hypothetical protein